MRKWARSFEIYDMRICFIGKHILKKEFLENGFNAGIFMHFANTFDKMFLIYETDEKAHCKTEYENIEIFLIPRWKGVVGCLFFVMRAVRIGVRLYRDEGIDVISASEPFGGGMAAVVLKALTGKKVMCQIQGQLLDLPAESYGRMRRIGSRLITKWVGKASDRVRCVSENIYRDAVKTGIPVEKLVVIPARVDIELFERERWEQRRLEIRKKYRCVKDETVLVFVGTLLADKGIFEVVEALDVIARDRPDVRGLIVGDGPYRRKLEARIHERNLRGVVSLTGFVEYAEVPAYIAAGDIFILPSKHEGTPRALLEAMAMGLPVIATTVGGIPELVKDGETGILLEHRTVEEIVRAVSRLLDDNGYRENLGRNARVAVAQGYSFERNADLLVKAHQELAS